MASCVACRQRRRSFHQNDALLHRLLHLLEGCVYRKSDSAILVMKTAKDRSRCDDAEALNRARERGIFVQRAMNSQPVVISGVRFEHSAQVGLAEYHHVVDTFTSDRSDQSLGEGVLPRRAWGDGLVADAHSP